MAISLVTSVAASSVASTTDVTTGSVDTTGANLITIAIHVSSGGVTPTVYDSKGNTWSARTLRASGSYSHVRLYDCYAPTVGSGHTFSVTAVSSIHPSMTVLAFSGADTSPFDSETGSGSTSGTSRQPGSITPANDNSVFVTALTHDTPGYNASTAIDSGFTVQHRTYATNGMPAAIAYYVQGTASALNPTWSWSTSDANVAAMAVYKGTGGGGGGSPNTETYIIITS